MANELKKLIQKIDEEGLGFLLKQAHVIIHNLNVDKINTALERVSRSGKRVSVKKRAAAGTASQIVRVEEAPAGKNFILVLGSVRKIFSRDEIRKLVAISHSGTDDAARSEQFFAWLKRNRRDVLLDAGIGFKRHPILKKLSAFLRTHYAVKK